MTMLNQRGIALPLTLMLLMALMSLTMALLSYAAFEPMIAKNMTDSTQARFAAEAGLERAFDLLRNTADWNTRLAGATAGVPAVLLLDVTAVGGPAGGGTFTVTVRNDTQAADVAITGVSPVDVDPGADLNTALIVTATGVAGVNGTAQKVLEAAITRIKTLPFPSALAFPGNEADVTFNGNANINGGENGVGFKIDGQPDSTCAAEYGIGVSKVLPSANPGANEKVVENALGSGNAVVKGKPETGTGTGSGANTVEADSRLTPDMVTKFINQAKAKADITLESKQATATDYKGVPTGLHFADIGDGTSCADPKSSTCWGTKEHPKVVWIKGEEDPTSAFAALQLDGNTTGYGVLIVEDGDLRVDGNFKWHGPIIVTGKWVGVKLDGNATVYGAVVSNETAADGTGFKEGVVTGNGSIRYSCEALALTEKTSLGTSILSWREAPGL
jgi:Tfp pilus assembly protein PilX